jgi:hypothetical protein
MFLSLYKQAKEEGILFGIKKREIQNRDRRYFLLLE